MSRRKNNDIAGRRVFIDLDTLWPVVMQATTIEPHDQAKIWLLHYSL